MKWRLRAGNDFDFTSAVSSYGFFVLAPNEWSPDEQTLTTAIPLDDDRAVACRLRATTNRSIAIEIPNAKTLSASDRRVIQQAVVRILRLDEDLSAFHDHCRQFDAYRRIAETKSGRLIRSATLFEDIVKTICTTNITWRQTVRIVATLTDRYGAPAVNSDATHAFPTPARLARVRLTSLKNHCKLGYRADYVRALAKGVRDGAIDLSAFENPDLSTDELFKQLRGIKGVGDYAAGNLCMLLGRYDRLAIDTELVRHFKTHYPRRRRTPKLIQKHYAAHAPYQFLIYWHELWNDYAAAHGPSAQWSPGEVGENITK